MRSVAERRWRVAELLGKKMSQKQIAAVVGVSESTVSRDVEALRKGAVKVSRPPDDPTPAEMLEYARVETVAHYVELRTAGEDKMAAQLRRDMVAVSVAQDRLGVEKLMSMEEAMRRQGLGDWLDLPEEPPTGEV